ncbi:hypothetical protein LP420_04245 [Massilia sp. B-10]|nr:hypothetical protein LP420_04245 [Massilia sp. B-10]
MGKFDRPHDTCLSKAISARNADRPNSIRRRVQEIRAELELISRSIKRWSQRRDEKTRSRHRNSTARATNIAALVAFSVVHLSHFFRDNNVTRIEWLVHVISITGVPPRTMTILNRIKKCTFTKFTEILVTRSKLPRYRKSDNLPRWLGGDMQSGASPGGAVGPYAADDGIVVAAADKVLAIIRDRERVVFFGTRK